MTAPATMLHVSCVARDGLAILIAGRSGSGKSDLALRLIDRGATLVSDDYTNVSAVDGVLRASAPTTIAGKIEIRGIGIVPFDAVGDVPVGLYVDLNRAVERLPDLDDRIEIAGVALPVIGLNAHEASAPIKVETALALATRPA